MWPHFISTQSPSTYSENVHISISSRNRLLKYRQTVEYMHLRIVSHRSSMMERSDGVVDISPHCQRCGSTNTKFCYYNNYSLAQPRYFCKGCRRYWTKGGSLRNVPVGGGCRKSRRGRAISNSRYHKSPSPLSYTSLDAGCVVTTSNSSSSNIDLAVVYANFLKQNEPEPVNAYPNDDSSALDMGDLVNGMPFELSPVSNVEGLMYSQSGDWWYETQLVESSTEGSLTRISVDKFTNEIHDISQIIDSWSSFDFVI